MPFLKARNICKRFADVVANDHVSLDVERGEVHALLGENGAGKTTLVNILYGLYTPDEGEILLEEKTVRISSPQEAIERHIGMIHQHFMLIPRLSVAENIILGLPSSRPPFLQIKQACEEVEKIGRKYDLYVDPRALVSELSVGLQQRVEILKALYRKIDLLVLDEPTSVLTPLEVSSLFKVIRRLTQDGLAVIFISHKLNEVISISDRITVLRKGKVVGTLRNFDTDPGQLARMMVGKEIGLFLEKPPAQLGECLLEVCHLKAEGSHGGKHVLNDVSFQIRRGEILGIAGVDGNGQGELAQAIAGLFPLSEGKILISGIDVTHFPPRKRSENKLSYIPADRQRVGTILDFSVGENLVLKNFRDPPFSWKKILLKGKEIGLNGDRMITKFDIKTSNANVRLSSLSGGNQQKVILSRELSSRPDVLIAVQPTRGLDVGSTKYVHECILDHRRRGGATLYISTELDEILGISDRIAVIYEGEIMGILGAGESIDLEQVSLMMGGNRLQRPQNSLKLEPPREKETTEGVV